MPRRVPPPDDDERTPYVTVQRFAELMGVGDQAVYRAVKRGDIPHVRIGIQIRIPLTALDDITRKAV